MSKYKCKCGGTIIHSIYNEGFKQVAEASCSKCGKTRKSEMTFEELEEIGRVSTKLKIGKVNE